jgi:hypothetical protein
MVRLKADTTPDARKHAAHVIREHARLPLDRPGQLAPRITREVQPSNLGGRRPLIHGRECQADVRVGAGGLVLRLNADNIALRSVWKTQRFTWDIPPLDDIVVHTIV